MILKLKAQFVYWVSKEFYESINLTIYRTKNFVRYHKLCTRTRFSLQHSVLPGPSVYNIFRSFLGPVKNIGNIDGYILQLMELNLYLYVVSRSISDNGQVAIAFDIDPKCKDKHVRAWLMAVDSEIIDGYKHPHPERIIKC